MSDNFTMLDVRKTELNRCPMCDGLTARGIIQDTLTADDHSCIYCRTCAWWIPCDQDGNIWTPNDLTVNGEMQVEEITKLKSRLRATAQTLIEEVGADGPKNAEEVAEEACHLIRRLNAENKALGEQISKWKTATGCATTAEARSCRERLDRNMDILVKVSDILEEWGAS